MVGGRDFKTQQFNVAVQGNGRQPGSAFKPFVLATALSERRQPRADLQVRPGQAPRRRPDLERHRGSRRPERPDAAAEATEKSVNSVFAQLILEGHAREGRRDGREDGLHTGIDAGPGDRARRARRTASPRSRWPTAYATLAAGGQARRRRSASPRCKDADGQGALLGEAQDRRGASTRPSPT